MIERDTKLTLQEVEQLCKLYMDCKLSVMQENELRYVLSKTDFHSQLIDDVRQLMRIELIAFDKPLVARRQIKRSWWSKRAFFYSVAASIVLLIGLSSSLLYFSSQADTNAYYIAYAGGHRLSEEDSKVQIKKDMRSAENFLKEMSELEAQAQQMDEQFFSTIKSLE